jgi:hypothetical protein
MKWLHNADTNEWEATTDEWRMGAYQDIATPQWYGFIIRLAPPYDRHESYVCDSAMEARKWCQAEVAHWPATSSQ